MNSTRNCEVAGLIPGLAQWVKDPALEPSSYSSDSTPSLGTSICRECGPKKTKKKKEKKKEFLVHYW